ncbi:membrane protein [Klebsiella aerogenes]|uniref:hypothetical protein n=1 Tax=Klebsiella aerogenes TaxID=548 RepID=UPI00063C873E|nr:hypothetical protein [Klebsiella aerogenes]KLF28686.1 membrane protein [Klebsiella aerogenes]
MADWFIATEGVKVVKDSASLWPQIITAVSSIGAALGGVSLTHHFTRRREEKALVARLESERLFIATELVLMLEQYAGGCYQVANDDGWSGKPVQSETEPCADYPELNLVAVSGDWRVLNWRHMYRIRELPVLQNEARRAIAYVAEIPVPPFHEDFFRERQYQFTRLGIRAVILAVRLRRATGLPETRLTGHDEWSAVSVFRKVWRRERSLRAAEAARNREWFQPVIPRHDNGKSKP